MRDQKRLYVIYSLLMTFVALIFMVSGVSLYLFPELFNYFPWLFWGIIFFVVVALVFFLFYFVKAENMFSMFLLTFDTSNNEDAS